MKRAAAALLAAVILSACEILPAEVARELLPGQTATQYRVADAALSQLIERHVDRPTSKQLVAGALDAIDAAIKAEGIEPAYDRPVLTGSQQSDMAKLAATIDLLAQKYPQASDPQTKAGLDRAKWLERVATDGMAKSLKECHTYFLPPDRAKTFNQPPQEYSGIGAQISPARAGDTLPEIATVFPNSPAERAGLRSGDRIKSVDGVPVDGFTPEEVATRIRGTEGTTVTLVLVRAGAERTVPIVRARLVPPRVIMRDYESGKIGYVSISAFNGDVTRQTSEAVRALIAGGVQAIVLDLRNNPGGDLSAAQDIGSIFTKGTLVQQIGRDGEKRPLRTNDKWYWPEAKPLVVLVNERSASGSEIVAAGVRANGSGTLVGTRTAGCVGIGQPRTLPDDSLLLVTVARMIDAKTGEELNGQGLGVAPDVVVAQDPNAGDAQLDAAIATLRSRL
ncbi:MAG TPA: S41 family peptidase [Candidatus Limnocylindria bacterium]|nr:S41 family peptidase [Candidatus Limnocylindria bacterium]